MNHQAVLNKIEQLSKREKILLLVTGVVAVLLLGFSFVIEPLSKEKALGQQLLANALSEQKLLVRQLEGVAKSEKEALQVLTPQRINTADKDTQAVLLLEKLLLQTAGLELISLESIRPKPLKEETRSPLEIYQVHMIGQYPVMLKYIADLQALPFSIYFEDFKYKVNKFPQADIYVTVSRHHGMSASLSFKEEKL